MEKPIGRMIKMIDEALIRRMNADLQEKNLTCGQLHMLLALSRAEGKTLPLKALEQQFQNHFQKLELQAEDCLMVGNDADEDGAAAELGIPVFLLTDCLINKSGRDLGQFPHGGFEQLQTWLREKLVP